MSAEINVGMSHPPCGVASDARQLRSQVLDARRDSKNEQDDEEEPDEAHSPHHSHRHVSRLHHVEPLTSIRAGATVSRQDTRKAVSTSAFF